MIDVLDYVYAFMKLLLVALTVLVVLVYVIFAAASSFIIFLYLSS